MDKTLSKSYLPRSGAPRARKEIYVGRSSGSGAVWKMRVLALRSRPAGGGFKPPPAALAEDRRGERGGKGARDASGGDQEDGAQPLAGGVAVDVSLRRDRWHQNRDGLQRPGMSLAGARFLAR